MCRKISKISVNWKKSRLLVFSAVSKLNCSVIFSKVSVLKFCVFNLLFL